MPETRDRMSFENKVRLFKHQMLHMKESSFNNLGKPCQACNFKIPLKKDTEGISKERLRG